MSVSKIVGILRYDRLRKARIDASQPARIIDILTRRCPRLNHRRTETLLLILSTWLWLVCFFNISFLLPCSYSCRDPWKMPDIRNFFGGNAGTPPVKKEVSNCLVPSCHNFFSFQMTAAWSCPHFWTINSLILPISRQRI